MKIMINFLSSNSGGALSYLRNILPLLAKKFEQSSEHSLCVLLNKTQKQCIKEVIDSVECIVIEKSANIFQRLLWERTALKALVKKQQVDVFFTPYQLAPNVTGVKTVSMIRNMEPFFFKKYRYDKKNTIRNIILAYACPKTLIRSDRVIAVSEFSKDYCTDLIGLAESKIALIYHGRDQRFSPVKQLDDERVLAKYGIEGNYVFTCGSMLPYRRCELILQGFLDWKKKDTILVIAGSSTDEQYQNYIKTFLMRGGVKNRVKWIGQVPVEHMRVLYRNSRFFVTATEIEACPNIGIEALSSGCHILASDNKPLPEIFVDAAEYFSPSADDHELTVKLDEMYLKSKQLNTLAISRAESFSWEKCSDLTFQCLTTW